MLPRVLAKSRALMAQDEVILFVVVALVRAEYDDIGGGVGELLLVEGPVHAQALHVSVCITVLETRTGSLASYWTTKPFGLILEGNWRRWRGERGGS